MPQPLLSFSFKIRLPVSLFSLFCKRLSAAAEV